MITDDTNHPFFNIQIDKFNGAFSPHFYALTKDETHYLKVVVFGQKTLLNKLQLKNCVFDENIEWIAVDSVVDAELKFFDYMLSNCKIVDVELYWNDERNYYLSRNISNNEFLACMVRRVSTNYATKNKRGYLNVCIADTQLFAGDKSVVNDKITLNYSTNGVDIVDYKIPYIFVGYKGVSKVDGCAFITNDSDNKLWLAIMKEQLPNYWCVLKV